jgi:hypothetical protein
MREKVAVICLLLCSSLSTLAQTVSLRQGNSGWINGVVRDEETSEPLPYCNVYINNTTIGTYSDGQGRFELKNIPRGQHELVVSHAGYTAHTRRVVIRENAGIDINIKLTITELKEVVVRAKRDKRWEKQLAKFNKLFFGQDHYKYCKIANPWALTFDAKGQDFSATASVALEITNDFLGYTITYTMKTFKFSDKAYTINGLARFGYIESPDPIKQKQWADNRNDVYRGSSRHLFKSIVDDQVAENGFELYREQTDIRSIVFEENLGNAISLYSTSTDVTADKQPGEYKIDLPFRLEAHYLKKKTSRATYRNIVHPVSWFEAKEGLLKVHETGIVMNPDQLVVSGYLGNQRIGELLPNNYEPEMDAPAVTVDSRVTIAELLEKPYIHTDRSYFYAGETVWMKGYMKYVDPILRDSLSGVIHIDFIDADQKTKILTKQYPIDSGTFTADIALSPDLRPGNYLIRSYTRWMLNFSDQPGFTKPIRILAKDEAVKMQHTSCCDADTTGLVVIHPGKTKYGLRDKITLSFSVLNTFGDPVMSNLSVSVTDATQSVPARNDQFITSVFASPVTAGPPREDKRFAIEYGVDFSGTVAFKKEPVEASLTLFEPGRKNTYGIITGEDGTFQRSLQFFDSTTMYIRATTFEGRPAKVALNKSKPVSARMPFVYDTLQLDVFISDNFKALSSFNSARVLNEVVITARKIEPPPSPAVIHGKGDFTITGDWLRQNTPPNLLVALQMTVPGLRTVPELRIGWGEGEPLITLDGVAINSVGSGTEDAMTTLASMPFQEIDRVDVIKYTMGSIYGARGAAGVIAIYTRKYDGDDGKEKPFNPAGTKQVTLYGYNRPAAFESPDYSKADDSNYVDLRSTIYWNANVKTGGTPSEVSFYAADLPTQYRIVVEGVTADGTPVRGVRIITVE